MRLRGGRAVGLGIRFGALALVAGLVACGGGGDPAPSASAGLAAESAALGRMQALAAVSTQQVSSTAIANPTAADLFEWAQWKWPTLFPAGPIQIDKELGGTHYAIRGYATGILLAVGITTGDVYALLPRPEDPLIALGNLANFAAEISADSCTFRPGSCQPPPTGALNDCVDPAMASLPTGYRWSLVYDYSGSLTGEQSIESKIDGPDNFEGQSAVKVTTTTSGTLSAEGVPITSTSKSEAFQQAAGGGLIKLLGTRFDAESSFLGFVSAVSNMRVYNPARENLEFFLQPGQSVTITDSSTTTTTKPVGTAPVTSSFVETYTFEAREPVTVFGKTYNTCRYTITEPNSTLVTTTWYLIGKGIAVKSFSTGDGEDQTTQLKSGTYNGTPL